ncbi:hypothetical protein Asd1617_05365 [Shigella dysenteriae 1617]|uniref:Uncharacterized protein n=1 Tax=Shigella dysenteriae 1617 TaxID=754093 RepID=A0A0A7A1S3_SHIDY|nr:hypothetical protein Asd1617_04311 [Shigella dysenteriae 1617]AHA68192.1 hypothetical protein Asd1617_05365 [Shigella dysenteriae 1617]
MLPQIQVMPLNSLRISLADYVQLFQVMTLTY